MKTPHGIYPAFTRILINKNINGERMLTTQIVRAVMRVARVRYLLLGAAGAGGVAAKMVSCIYYLFYPFSSQSQYGEQTSLFRLTGHQMLDLYIHFFFLRRMIHGKTSGLDFKKISQNLAGFKN